MTRTNDDRFWLLWNDPVVPKNYFSENPNLTPEQIDRLFNDPEVYKNTLAQNPNLNPEQFDRLWNDPEVDKDYLAAHYRFNREPSPVGIFNWTALEVWS